MKESIPRESEEVLGQLKRKEKNFLKEKGKKGLPISSVIHGCCHKLKFCSYFIPLGRPSQMDVTNNGQE